MSVQVRRTLTYTVYYDDEIAQAENSIEENASVGYVVEEIEHAVTEFDSQSVDVTYDVESPKGFVTETEAREMVRTFLGGLFSGEIDPDDEDSIRQFVEDNDLNVPDEIVARLAGK
jgi:hypothetical protein